MVLTVLVGPPGSGKSTKAKGLEKELGFVRISQDEQGKEGHWKLFEATIAAKQPVVVDRMNFDKKQRARYLEAAKNAGYATTIIVVHQPYEVCLQRALARENHETIKDEKSARAALKTFFSKYEKPQGDEADVVVLTWPKFDKPLVIYSDLDGTLCDIEHRRHFVRKPKGEKKDWKSFFEGIRDDKVNQPVMTVLHNMGLPVVYCSGRSDDYREATQDWLDEHGAPAGPLYMRNRHDHRADFIVKEILLDFELLTRYRILFCLDDRDQVVKMLRSRGLTVFQVAEGDF